MTHPISKDDQYPRGHKISDAAARALHDFKVELHAWPAYLEAITTSTVIELLTWYWRETRRANQPADPLEFRAQTRRGRAIGQHVYRNSARPIDHRLDQPPKAQPGPGPTDLSKLDPRGPDGLDRLD